MVSLWGPLWVSLFYILLDDFFGFKLTSGFSSSVQKPLKVPSLARSMQKPLKVPSLARSVPKPLKMGQAQACECAEERGGGAPKLVGFQPLSLFAADLLPN